MNKVFRTLLMAALFIGLYDLLELIFERVLFRLFLKERRGSQIANQRKA